MLLSYYKIKANFDKDNSGKTDKEIYTLVVKSHLKLKYCQDQHSCISVFKSKWNIDIYSS